MQPFLAMIVPVASSGGGSGGPVDPGYSPPWATPSPPSIWPGPHPSHPIMLPGMPGWGGGAPQPPLGIWGPGDPRPTNPIAGWNPGTGTFPPPTGGATRPPGAPVNLPAQDPSGSGWVYAFVPGYGWMWAQVPQPPTTEPPVTEPPDSSLGPTHPIQPTVPQPKPATTKPI